MTRASIVTIVLLLAACQHVACGLIARVSQEAMPVNARFDQKLSVRGLLGRSQFDTDCVSCRRDGLVCPSFCCSKKWHPCTSRKSCCNRGWQCVRWRWGKRCEPARMCVRKWGSCSNRRSRCCYGLHCKRRGRSARCEPR